MLLDEAHDKLGWPSQEEIFHPSGVGATIIAQLSEKKLGNAISRLPDGDGVRVGVLASNPDATESPLAIICDFPRKVSEATLRETQRLAWNFGRTSLLITIEPHIVRKWTCCEPPSAVENSNKKKADLFVSPEIEPPIEIDATTGKFISEQIAASLHWVELLTGEFFRQHEARFKPEKRADQQLLSNLKEVRQKLQNNDLPDTISHDLLARIIFIQFLFDRKDSDGKAALDEQELLRLHTDEGVLSRPFKKLEEILNSYEDTYALFRWLNSRFNGDLFPGKGTPEEQELAWEAERQQVKPAHLDILARFVGGKERMKDGQLSLWPYYSFDAIPLEFISTIYEEFVKKDKKSGVHYTPSHVADLMLDSVLPWQGEEWDLHILDPACGSGVFLVKAFQRLVFRWKTTHPDQPISGDILTGLLERNLYGIDLDAQAVRVASFSLYLAMCDELDPRDYWREVHFPILRGRRLVSADFFSEEHPEFCTTGKRKYDIVIGNPPWGKNTATLLAKTWQKAHKWPISLGDIGPLFIAKALELTKPDGYVALLQPASTLLYNHLQPARQLREKIFNRVRVDEIINFAALRFVLFKDAISPTCAIMLCNTPPDGEAFWYVCPKMHYGQDARYRIIIEPQDVHKIFYDEVKDALWLWSTLLWGGPRDRSFIRRLGSYTTLDKLKELKIVELRQGIIRSNNQRYEPAIENRPILEAKDFPKGNELILSYSEVSINQKPYVDSAASTDYSAFAWPQLLIKQSFMRFQGRFRAALIESDPESGGVICSNSYLSVHADQEHRSYLDLACLTFNSQFAVYYLLLTSGRFAMDRNEAQEEAFRRTPLPPVRSGLSLDFRTDLGTMEAVDEQVRREFDFKEADWLLIEDLMQFTLPDYKGGSDSPGRLPTHRKGSDGTDEPELQRYCETFRRVLQAAYGEDKLIGAVIYSEAVIQSLIPVRLVSIYLNLPEVDAIQIQPLEPSALQDQLTRLYQSMLSTDENRHNFYQRCVRTYDTVISPSGQTAICINLIKPDRVRYWIRSVALRDADEVAADIALWSGTFRQQPLVEEEAIIA